MPLNDHGKDRYEKSTGSTPIKQSVIILQAGDAKELDHIISI
jgi:hypothetical protein